MKRIHILTKSNLLAGALMLSALLLTGCGFISGDTKIDEGVVIAPKLKLRSTTAPAALELAEVKRGDRLDILEQAQFKTPTRVVEWYKVRTKDKAAVEGWVETRYVINKTVVDKVNTLFEKSKELPSQGAGHLKVQTKLRLEADGDVATYLSRGTAVEVVGKARTTVKADKPADTDETDDSDDDSGPKTVLWYEVRLPDSEVLRAGWVGAQQVQLDVPDEILHLEGEGRRFTGWVVLDQTKDKKGVAHNNYVGLMKSLSTEGPIDFTRVWVLYFTPDSGRYNGAYIKDGFRGVLPVTLGVAGGRKGFTIRNLDEKGKPVPIEYETIRDSSGRLIVKQLTAEPGGKKPAGRRGR
ncbi:MAG TPA: SH3 domain-containing protein [Blastocatellia bacterium]|nr:SH3 domain-containing protein [Blastocatellia bacterium]